MPDNAIWNSASSITQTWNGVEWLPSATGSYNEEETMSECHFKCKPHYTWKGATCEANVQTAECEGLPENASWNKVSSITQTWNGTEWLPSATGSFNEEESIGECRFKCNDNYHWENNQCLPNTKTGNCTSKPANTVWNDNGANGKFTQIWNGSEWEPETYSSSYNTVAGICRYKCNTNYNWNSSNSKCVAATQTYTCTGLPANAVWNNVSSYTQTWTGEEWTPSATAATYNTTASSTECRFICATNYSWKNSQCVADTRTANCTELPSTGASWNTVSSITQTWNGSSWQPTTTGSYNTTASTTECRFKCNTNYTWDGSKCVADTRTASCTDIPANASWNSVSAIIQTWNGTEWTPANTSTYNEESSTTECRFKCNTNYSWKNSQCVADTRTANCTGLPSTGASWNSVSSIEQTWNGSEWIPSSTGVYNVTASTSECRFKCNTNYTWEGSICKADSKVSNCTGLPENATWNIVSTISQTWNGSSWQPSTSGSYNETSSTTECRYKCAINYEWNGASCVIPECSPTSATPCRDSSSGLTWSAKASTSYSLHDALDYCNSYSEGGLSGWHLPNIDELKTLLIADRVNNCQVSEVNNCLSYSSCWSCLTCSQTGTPESNSGCKPWGTSYDDGRYSKLGDTGMFRSSSISSDSGDLVSTWNVNFTVGYIIFYFKGNPSDVRCVRNTD